MNARRTNRRLSSSLKTAQAFAADGLSLVRVILGLAMFFNAAKENWGTVLFILLLAWLVDLASIATNWKWGSFHDAFPNFDGYGLADRWMAGMAGASAMLFIVRTTGSFITLLLAVLAYVVVLGVVRVALARLKFTFKDRHGYAVATMLMTILLAWSLLGFLVGLLVSCLAVVALFYKEMVSRRLDQIEQRR